MYVTQRHITCLLPTAARCVSDHQVNMTFFSYQQRNGAFPIEKEYLVAASDLNDGKQVDKNQRSLWIGEGVNHKC